MIFKKLAINILEGPWKARVCEICPNTADYINFMKNTLNASQLMRTYALE
jgi:ATP/ADP translocase